MRQDFRQVVAILDYRRARTAVDLFNGGRQGFEQLQKQPELTDFLLELARAQAGDDSIAMGDVYDALRKGRPADEDEEE